jgi:GT2 family glycosyltransferase
MIPVIIVPVLNRPELLYRMIRSIDVVFDRLLVIDNGDVADREYLEALDSSVRVIAPGHNLGVAASWNLGMKATPEAPWWFITGFDMEYTPGDLAQLVAEMESSPKPRTVHLRGYSSFALNRATLERVGYFDENFHPAYFEDNDHAYRCYQEGLEVVHLINSSKHEGSATIFGDQSYRDQNHKTFEKNKAYYIAKWGGGPEQEFWKKPFGVDGEPPISPERIRRQAWRLR